MKKFSLLLISALITCHAFPQNLSTRSFTNNDLGSDPNTLNYNGTSVVVDLSSISDAEIYRATLDPYQRPERYFEIEPDFQYGVTQASLNHYLIVSGTLDTLELLGPRYLTFDATEAVQQALEYGQLVLNIINDGQGIGETLSLDVLCDKPAPVPIEQVDDAFARFENGQTMITFAEVDPIANSETWTQTAYLDAVENIYMHDISPKIRYRIYRSETPINGTEDIIDAELIDEIMPMSGWNYRSKMDSDVIHTYPTDQMTVALPGTGIYVHTCKQDNPADAWYFVSHTVNGAEDFSGIFTGVNATEQVTETTGPGMVLKWKEEIITGGWYWWPDRNPTLYYYVRWESPPYWNLPSRGFNYRVGLPNEEYQVDNPMLEICPHAWGGNYSGAYDWWSFENGGILLTQTHLHYNSYTAFHENICTLKPWDKGTVQPYFQARVSAFVYDFLVEEFNIDTNQIILTGGSMGGAAGHFWGMRNAEMFSYILSIVGNNIPDEDPCCVWEFENWGGYGKLGWQLPFSNLQMVRFGHIPVYPQDNVSVWDYYDNTIWLEENPTVETPFISFSNSVDDPAIGWEQAWKNANTVYDTKRPHVFTWGSAGHYWPLGWEDITTKKNQSVPAFTNCSLDDDLGGTPGQATEGQRNQYMRWDTATITDTPEKWEIDLHLDESAPENLCTVDVTPRRLQNFTIQPQTDYHWEIIENGFTVDGGVEQSDEHALLTISELVIKKNVRRLIIEPWGVGIDDPGRKTRVSAHPNPFSEYVVLDYTDPTSGPVSVDIFDARLRLVFHKDFTSEKTTIQSFKWSGENFSGTKVNPGVYFIRLQGREFSRTVKVIRN